MTDPLEIAIGLLILYMAYKLLYLIENYKTNPINKKEDK